MSAPLYEPLDEQSDEIRLIGLQPSTFGRSPICCTSFKASLENPPSYRALSYVWGDLNTTVPVTINGHRFFVTQNLHAALIRLRHTRDEVVLWIDAICIDQSNIPERNCQVQHMRDIYRTAELVLVWLGEEEDDSNLAMDLITSLEREYIRNHQASSSAEPDMQGTVSRVLTDDLAPRRWKALTALFTRPYWSRVWVYQEFVVARAIEIMTGSRKVPGNTLLRAHILIYMLRESVVKMDLDSSVDELVLCLTDEHLRPFISHHSSRQSRSHLYDLPSLILPTQYLNSTDPRDKIFALLGLDDVGDIVIKPDYSLPTVEVYINFVRRVAKKKGQLSNLSYAGIGIPQSEPNLHLPSWVPDFRFSQERNDFNTFQRVTKLAIFSASGDADAVVSFPDSHILRASGVVAASIDKLVPATDSGTNDMIQEWQSLAVQAQKDGLHPTNIPIWQAFFRTAIADCSGYGYGRPDFKDEEEATGFYDVATGFMWLWGKQSALYDHLVPLFEPLGISDYATGFAAWCPESAKADSPLTELSLLEPFLGKPDSANRLLWSQSEDKKKGESCSAQYWVKQMSVVRGGKSFFITPDGYMGLGPPGAKPGDLISVVLGCEMPLAIRRAGDHFVIVGPCYVYGMMKGEVVQAARDGKLSIEDLEFW